MDKFREIEIIANQDGSVEKNLLQLGYSTRICTALRKEIGLICLLVQEKLCPIRIVDNVRSGQKFVIKLKDTPQREIPKYNFPIEIVYEDDDLAVINKPSGIAVISTSNHYGKSLENALANIWGSSFVYRPVNRLDRDTSGLMIVAKNQLTHSILSAQKIKRTYVALVEGIVEGEGIIDQPLGLETASGMKRIVRQDGKRAITLYRSLKVYENQNYSLVECELQTGRTHQIRAHFAWLGHPLCGDKLYNSNCKNVISPNGKIIDRQALHSWKIQFIHPITQKKLEFCCHGDFV